MRTRVAPLLFALVVSPWGRADAQSARDSVLTTIQRVLDQMRTRDTTGLRAAFDSTARMIFVPDSAARPTRPGQVSRFLADVSATPAEKAFDERIYDPVISIDGPIAQVWTYYTFREGAKFSHCGTDAFTLMRTGGGWRIVNWIWTARSTGCTRTE